jgi:hypothetical protein
MIEQTLFKIPYWSMSSLNFKEKKKEVEKLLKNYPETKQGKQTFLTNRSVPKPNFADTFVKLFKEEFAVLSNVIKRDFRINDIWSVSYKKGDHHPPHNHGSTGLSGILYLDMNDQAPMTSYIQPWNDYVSDHTIYSEISVGEGDIIVIPQFVQHFSSPNTSKNIKRIVSWDMSFTS